MIRPIMRDVLFLKKKAVPATKNDMSVVQDLLDTLKANEAGCVGMAANMIGVNSLLPLHMVLFYSQSSDLTSQYSQIPYSPQ